MKDFYKKYKFPIYLFIFSFILRLILVLTINTPIISDFKTMYDASLELLNNTTNYKKMSYFIDWGYQMGHVIYQFLLLKIYNSVTFLKIVNCLITSSIVVILYLLTKEVSSNKSAKTISIFYSIFLFPLLLNTVLTNQHLPVLLTLIAIYILLKINYRKYFKSSIIIGILLGLSNILRSEGIVIITSIILYFLYLIIIKKKNIKKITCSFLTIFVTYTLIFNLTSTILIKTDISPSGLNNKNPTWKFVLGFNYETNGMYSEEDASIYAHDQEKSKEIVKERVSAFYKIPLLFIKKTKVLWLNSDLSWSIGHIPNRGLYKTLTIINQLFIVVLHLLTGLSIINFFKNKYSNTQVLMTLILLTYFGVYLLIEVMPRYAYSLQVFEIVLAGIGLDNLFKLLKKIKIKRNYEK